MGLWPMLSYCWEVQKKHSVNGLLPFNGDETYVAGGFFPRSGLNHGSADSTLVFIESGKWMAHWATGHGLWSRQFADDQLSFVRQSINAYRRYFLAGDRLWANAPEREDMVDLPRFRYGVCEAQCGWFGWTQRTENSRYLCPNCLSSVDLPRQNPGNIEVSSVSLLPTYIESDVLSRDELVAVIERIVSRQEKGSHIPSVPDRPGCVGYDPGLILLGLLAISHPATDSAAERLLSMLDSSGSWVEYYNAADLPSDCCFARPWESGINAYSMIRYLLHH
jgi:hypothetical protein